MLFEKVEKRRIITSYFKTSTVDVGELAHATLWFSGKVYFLSLLVNQLAPWIRCVFHDDNKVHRANETLNQLGFAFLSYLEQGARSLSVFLQLR